MKFDGKMKETEFHKFIEIQFLAVFKKTDSV